MVPAPFQLMSRSAGGALTERSLLPRTIVVADAGSLLGVAAKAVVESAHNRLPDLGQVRVLLPNLHCGDEFKQQVLHCSARPELILPGICTYAQLAGGPDAADGSSEATQRVAWLYGALRSRAWFDDGSRWGICQELGALFDELVTHNVAVPHDIGQFRAQLRAAYRSAKLRGIDLEATLVSDLWFALEGTGSPSPAAKRKLYLASLALNAGGPLIVVQWAAPTSEQEAFFIAWARRQPVQLVRYSPQHALADSISGFLNVVWPSAVAAPDDEIAEVATVPMLDRIAQLRDIHPTSPLVGRLSLFGALSCEQEARAAAHSIKAWLAETPGQRQVQVQTATTIAVIVQDRLVARRLRALLDRDNILVSDEAGWKISTTSAATVVSRWLDTAADDFYHRDVLDLLKSPFTLFDVNTQQRRGQAYLLEQIIRSENVIKGLAALERAVANHARNDALRPLLKRLRKAQSAQFRGDARNVRERATILPMGAWLTRLDDAMQILGISSGLERDAAGKQLLELLRKLSAGLADDRQTFTFSEWRAWLNAEFESATFRDDNIDSPVVFAQLPATRLRRFDKVLVLGADTAHLHGGSASVRFFNQQVRASLGLPTAAVTIETLRQDLIALIALAGEVRISWQAYRAGESNAPAALIDFLQVVHAQAYGNSLPWRECEMWLRGQLSNGELEFPRIGTESFSSVGAMDSVPAIAGGAPRPRAPGLVPERLSASAHASLVACPYQFFARHMLRLNEAGEVEEQVEKRDFGEAVHRTLKAFHEQVPVVGAHPATGNLKLLHALAEREFAPLVARNALAAGYRAEWQAMAPGYLEWQCRREAEGWRFHSAEVRREHPLTSGDGARLVLTGRLDRVDVNLEGKFAVLDYKARNATELKKALGEPGEEIQLATYALLLQADGGEPPIEAGYVALERAGVTLVPVAGDLAEISAKAVLRLDEMLIAIRGGAELPAQGRIGVCAYCEMRGLCRKDYWERV